MTLELDIIEVIKSVGFPIAAFMLMYYMLNTTIKKNTEVILQLKELIEQMSVLGCPYLKMKGGRNYGRGINK